ncbi:hypothetical protein BH20ACI3_BH20ACI3_39840 [soil metagenome]
MGHKLLVGDAENSRRIYEPLENLKRHLAEVLDGAAKALNVDDTLGEEKLDHVLKEMPRLDPRHLTYTVCVAKSGFFI